MASAQLGNLTYTDAELNQPIAAFNQKTFVKGPGGSNTVVMLHDYMLDVASFDSGIAPCALHVFDVKDPRKPVLKASVVDSPEVLKLREVHAMPIALVGGKEFLVLPNITGIQFFDVTDPMAIKAAGAVALPGVNKGDYAAAAWMSSWSYPYVYVGTTDQGLYIVDATNPMTPSIASHLTQANAGGFKIGPTYAAGNFVVVTGFDDVPTKISLINVSDPKDPQTVKTVSYPTTVYSSVVIGDKLIGTGKEGNYAFMNWTTKGVFTTLSHPVFGKDKGGYCTFQDDYAFCGQSSEGYRKINLKNPADPKVEGTGDVVDAPGDHADTDFATVMGNLIYLGNDHGTGAAFFPHQKAPDTTPPKVLNVFPSDGEVKQPLTTHVTIFFSDDIHISSMNATNLIIRKSNGTVVPGSFSRSSFNAVSFGPTQALDANTTYEVVVVPGGVTDLVGNKIVEQKIVRFSTGGTVEGGDAGVPVVVVDSGGAGAVDAGQPGPEASVTGGNGGNGGSGGATGGGAGIQGGGSGGSDGAGTGGVGTSGSVAPDAGTVAQGGSVLSPPSADSAGCGCSVPGHSSSTGFFSLFAGAFLLGAGRIAVRRRRDDSIV